MPTMNIRGNFTMSAAVPWQPTDIAGCVLWLKADAITGLSDTDPIGTWSDQSGNGHDMTQAAAASKPLYRTNQINSLPAVYFDGTNDWMDATLTIGLDNLTVFVVHVCPVGGGTAPFWVTWGTYDPIIGASQAADRVWFDARYEYFTDLGWSNGTWYITDGWRDAGNYYMGQNGSDSADNPQANTWATTPTAMALATQTAGGYSAGGRQYQAEVIIYNSALSSGNRGLVRTYLNGRYAIY